MKRLGAEEECVNYGSESFEADLVRATEGYVDVYFWYVLSMCSNRDLADMSR